jgi:hypothetical protein
MRNQFLVSVICLALAGPGCEGASSGEGSRLPAGPSPAPSPAPTPPPAAFPSIAVGEVVRFQFTADDVACVGAGGRCRSYNVTAPSSGKLEAVATSVSGDSSFVSTLEMYVVPGGDYWDVGPGPRISVTVPAAAGATYEIRMYSATVPSVELELRTSLQ